MLILKKIFPIHGKLIALTNHPLMECVLLFCPWFLIFEIIVFAVFLILFCDIVVIVIPKTIKLCIRN